MELGSTNYWYRTWPAVFNLLDLPISPIVRQRAKMFVDIAMIEAEQATTHRQHASLGCRSPAWPNSNPTGEASIQGVRGGQKSRAKKSDLGHLNGVYHNMYYSLSPNLYGDNGTSLNVQLDTNSGYKMSNVSILMHQLGKSPATDGR